MNRRTERAREKGEMREKKGRRKGRRDVKWTGEVDTVVKK